MDYRIPEWFSPKRYELFIDVTPNYFTGSVVIDLEVNQPTKEIPIHAVSPLRILSAEIISPVRSELSLESCAYEMTLLKANQELRNSLVVKILFVSKYLSDGRGCYVTYFPDSKMISTHFAPTFARMAFPCMDEPSKKSVFKLTVSCEAGYKVVSNGQLYNLQIQGSSQVYEFCESPLMPTYLVHWSVFKPNSHSKNGIVSAHSYFPACEGFVDLAASALEYFCEYLNFEYPLPKLDLISVACMSVSAMENWGCICFHSSVMENSRNKRVSYMVLLHELAHNWFGNLVTMEWVRVT